MYFVILLQKAIGKEVTIVYPHESVTGKLVDVDDLANLTLTLECNDGTTLLVPYNERIYYIKIRSRE